MLDSRPKDALGSLVKTIETLATADFKQYNDCGDCRYENVNYSLTDNLKARYASTSINNPVQQVAAPHFNLLSG